MSLPNCLTYPVVNCCSKTDTKILPNLSEAPLNPTLVLPRPLSIKRLRSRVTPGRPTDAGVAKNSAIKGLHAHVLRIRPADRGPVCD